MHQHHRASCAARQEERPPRVGWHVRCSAAFLDADLSDRARFVFMILDGIARSRTYCYPSNETLAARARKPTSSIKQVLDELESAGWIARVYSERNRRDRLGIILRRRTCAETPAADSPEALARAEFALRSAGSAPPEGEDATAHEAGNPATVRPEIEPHRGRKSGLMRGQKSGRKEDRSRKTRGDSSKKSADLGLLTHPTTTTGGEAPAPQAAQASPLEDLPGPGRAGEAAPPAPARPLAGAMAQALDNLKVLHSLAQDAVVNGEPSPFAGPMPGPAPPREDEPRQAVHGPEADRQTPRAAREPSKSTASGAGSDTSEATPAPAEDLPPALAGRLDEDERRRFGEVSPRTRDRVSALMGAGDRICEDEARRLLRPPPPPEIPASEQATDELLMGLRGRPDRIPAAAGRLAEEFGDHKSYSGFLKVCEAACAGQVEGGSLVDAHRQATGLKAKNPGAIFMHAMKPAMR